MSGNNAIQFPGPQLKDGDGEDEETLTSSIGIELVTNGFIVRAMLDDGEEWTHVYPMDGKGDVGPQGMINDLIMALGLQGRVTLVKDQKN